MAQESRRSLLFNKEERLIKDIYGNVDTLDTYAMSIGSIHLPKTLWCFL